MWKIKREYNISNKNIEGSVYSLHRLQQYERHSKNIRWYNVQSWEAACDAHVTMGETATGCFVNARCRTVFYLSKRSPWRNNEGRTKWAAEKRVQSKDKFHRERKLRASLTPTWAWRKVRRRKCRENIVGDWHTVEWHEVTRGHEAKS